MTRRRTETGLDPVLTYVLADLVIDLAKSAFDADPGFQDARLPWFSSVAPIGLEDHEPRRQQCAPGFRVASEYVAAFKRLDDTVSNAHAAHLDSLSLRAVDTMRARFAAEVLNRGIYNTTCENGGGATLEEAPDERPTHAQVDAGFRAFEAQIARLAELKKARELGHTEGAIDALTGAKTPSAATGIGTPAKVAIVAAIVIALGAAWRLRR